MSALDIQQPLINGQGTSERDWQCWDGFARLPAREANVLVPQGCRAVILSPHPDDEVLATGGLLATLAAMNREVLVVGVTDGAASHPHSKRWTPTQLAAVRRAESEAGLRTLGITTAAMRLALDDGALALQRDALIAALHDRIQSRDVVIATWRLDGHPDHEAVGEAAARLCERKRATLIEVPIWAWHWAVPADHRLPWDRAVRMDFGADVLRLKQAAIAHHRSQLLPDETTGAPPILPAWALERWTRPFEVFFI